ncbi:MAG: SIMPL domain-containing protein [Alkalilacustris sp.]
MGERVCFGVAAGAALALWMGAAAAAEITVVGEGSVAAVPDIATLRLGVRERAGTAEAALEAAARAMEGVLAELSEAGVAPSDIQTSELSLHPLWHTERDRDTVTLQGFEAGAGVQVRLRDTAAVGGVVSAAVAAGASRFDGLQFGVADPDALGDEARRLAVQDALRRGAVHAEAAGLTLGPVRSITEEGASVARPQMMRSMDMAAEAMPIASGEITVTARVTVVFAPAP